MQEARIKLGNTDLIITYSFIKGEPEQNIGDSVMLFGAVIEDESPDLLEFLEYVNSLEQGSVLEAVSQLVMEKL